MKNLVEEFRWRGLFHDMMPGTEEQLLKEIIERYYPGTAIEINKLLKKANTFITFCKRKKGVA